MNPQYPNLELLEYKARLALTKNTTSLKKIQDRVKKGVVTTEFDVYVFPQIWGSTCTGFDITSDGQPVISGSAMTKEYTTVIHEILTDTYVVFFGNKLCYMVDNANEKFLKDLENKNLNGLKKAREEY